MVFHFLCFFFKGQLCKIGLTNSNSTCTQVKLLVMFLFILDHKELSYGGTTVIPEVFKGQNIICYKGSIFAVGTFCIIKVWVCVATLDAPVSTQCTFKLSDCAMSGTPGTIQVMKLSNIGPDGWELLVLLRGEASGPCQIQAPYLEVCHAGVHLR